MRSILTRRAQLALGPMVLMITFVGSFVLHTNVSVPLHSASKLMTWTISAINDTVCTPRISPATSPSPKQQWDTSLYLVGAPTDRYKDNLRNDTHYITSWVGAGFSNQFITHVNTIYLGTLSDRIPVLPPLSPNQHISGRAGILPFGDIFNLTELREQIQRPVLEWRDVKKLPPFESGEKLRSSETEHLGCWSTRPTDQNEPTRNEPIVNHLGLDVAYTRIPDWTRKQPGEHEIFITYYPLTTLIYPGQKVGKYPIMSDSPQGLKSSPDTHMACFDFLYYATSGRGEFDWFLPWAPAWRFVGRYLRFNDPVISLSKMYASKALGREPEQIPPFIAVHIRRGDFARLCLQDNKDPELCLNPLSEYADLVQEVQEELFLKRNISVSNVIVASDEKDPKMWDQISTLGWKWIDHNEEQTIETFGEWFPPIIDIAVQSLAIGYVGTATSTFSLLSQKRVEDWNNGVTRMVSYTLKRPS